MTLRLAHIEGAAGIVAGTNEDTNNLSIVVTARDINPDLFIVARQNRRANKTLFEAAQVEQVMERSSIIAHAVLALITAPLLAEFLRSVRDRDREWVLGLVSRLIGVVDNTVPDIWTVTVNGIEAPALLAVMDDGQSILLEDILRDSRNPEEFLQCMPLMIKRGYERHMLPTDDLELVEGDQILFCAPEKVRARVGFTLQNIKVLRYVQTGVDKLDGTLWRWIAANGAS